MSLPEIGTIPLKQAARYHNRTDITVSVVRRLDEFQKIMVLRALTYMSEQDCPYDEEYDGNDLCALHLIAHENNEPVGTLRLRFFNGFCKIERVCVRPDRRGGAILTHMMAHAFEVASRKGYRRMLAHMQKRLSEMWDHVMVCRVRTEDPEFQFSGYDYVNLEIDLPEHPDVIEIDADPFLLLRPEGDWDQPGVLDPKDPNDPSGDKQDKAA